MQAWRLGIPYLNSGLYGPGVAPAFPLRRGGPIHSNHTRYRAVSCCPETDTTTMNTSSKLALCATPAVIGMAAALLIPSPAAAASDSLALTGACTGSLVGTYAVGDSAQMEIWYSPVDGGKNCIKTVSSKASERYLRVWATAVGTDQANSDEGYYRHYAGPIVLTGTAGTCISVTSKASPTTRVDGAASRTITAEHCG